MKLMICGHGRHGKDTVAELINKLTGLTFQSSSWFIAEKMFNDPECKLYGKYNTVLGFYEARSEHRTEWHDWITAYNAVDLARLPREIYAVSDMYVGLRNDREFFAAQNEGLFDLSLWVDASKRKPPEAVASNKMKPEYCDIIIDNNSGLKDLEYKVSRLCNLIRKCQTFEFMMEAVQKACKGGKCGR